MNRVEAFLYRCTPLLLVVVVASAPAPGHGQNLPSPPRGSAYATYDLRRRLTEVDRLLAMANLSRAESLLAELEEKNLPRRDLLPRYIKLNQLKGEHAEAVRLCHEALQLQPKSPRLLRELALSLIALDERVEAVDALRRFVVASPNRRSGLIVSVDLWQKNGYVAEALVLCDSARVMLNEPRFLARRRAACLFALDRHEEGTDELVTELRANPLNLPLIRKELLDDAEAMARFEQIIAHLQERAAEPRSVPGERLLAANLLLVRGDHETAVATVLPLLEGRAGSVTLLQNAATLAREMPLLEDDVVRLATTRYLMTILEELARAEMVEASLRTRILDILAQVSEEALTAGMLAADPVAAAARMQEVLLLVRQGHPLSPHLYSAQIRLAHYQRDVLGQPDAAAASLERLLTDLDLPLEGVALARLTLGECYLAAGDTARGRLVLTRLGRGSRFREAAGHAHYHLARLDLAEGHWETARDRFASVALDNPMANYANNALDLGLAIAEELDNPTGGPAMLTLYARSSYFDLTVQPDSQRVALARYIRVASRQLDLEQPQHLLERSRFELARLYWDTGRLADALLQCDRVILDHPDGRYPAEALALRGSILAGSDESDQARDAYERLLLQYPDYLFADDIRDRLRSLP